MEIVLAYLRKSGKGAWVGKLAKKIFGVEMRLYMKCEGDAGRNVSVMHGQTDRQTDRQTDKLFFIY